MDNNEKLYPVEILLLDHEEHEITTIHAYESQLRIDMTQVPDGWHRCAISDGEGGLDLIKHRAVADHLNDYLTKDNIDELLDENDGWLYSGGVTTNKERQTPIELPATIYPR